MDVRVHRTRLTRIERIDADLFRFYQLAGSALAYGVRRVLILLANSAKLFRAPEGRRKLAGGGARAQPPGQVEEDCSRPGRDAGPEFATGLIPVRRPFRARDLVVAFPVATLRSATG